MRLSFDFAYENYDDAEHWLPRLKEMRDAAARLEGANLGALPEGELLDRMEDVEELMRYYTVTQDYPHLEKVMRLDQRLIQEGNRRGLGDSIAYQYFRLEFERVNAALYRVNGQQRKAAEAYRAASDIALACTADLKENRTLADERKLYVGWACVEVLSETAQAFDAVSDHAGALNYSRRTFELLEWVRPYMDGASNLLDKAAELYCNYGGVFFQNGDPGRGRVSYQRSVDIFEAMDDRYGSDFWYARSLWAMAHYGMQEYLCGGNADLMLKCERLCRSALDMRFETEREIAIARAALAVILAQQGIALQQAGNLSKAIEQTKRGVDMARDALKVLKREAGDKDSGTREIIERVIVRLHSSFIGAMDSLGVQLYFAQRSDEAKQVFREVLELLDKHEEYGLSEVAGAVVRTECMFYQALISLNEGNADEAEFYAQQVVTLTENLPAELNNPGIPRMRAVACSVLAELHLNNRDKAKALQCAEAGLSACAEWQRLEPQGDHAQIAALLEKFRKKASRRFF